MGYRAIVKSGLSCHAVGVGAGDVFQCLSTCYFGTPQFWALLKVAATLFREEVS